MRHALRGREEHLDEDTLGDAIAATREGEQLVQDDVGALTLRRAAVAADTGADLGDQVVAGADAEGAEEVLAVGVARLPFGVESGGDRGRLDGGGHEELLGRRGTNRPRRSSARVYACVYPPPESAWISFSCSRENPRVSADLVCSRPSGQKFS